MSTHMTTAMVRPVLTCCTALSVVTKLTAALQHCMLHGCRVPLAGLLAVPRCAAWLPVSIAYCKALLVSVGYRVASLCWSWLAGGLGGLADKHVTSSNQEVLLQDLSASFSASRRHGLCAMQQGVQQCWRLSTGA